MWSHDPQLQPTHSTGDEEALSLLHVLPFSTRERVPVPFAMAIDPTPVLWENPCIRVRYPFLKSIQGTCLPDCRVTVQHCAVNCHRTSVQSSA